MKDQVLYMMKMQLRKASDDLTYSNLQEQVEVFSNCFAILHATSQLPEVAMLQKNEEHELPPLEVEEEKPEDEPIEEAPKDTSNTRGPFRFERKFKGGFIPEVEAFVPEKTVRELELRHGDLVYAKFIKKQLNGPPIYEYEVAERKNERGPEDRIQIDYGIVEYDRSLNRYVLNKTAAGKMIKLDETPYTVMLPEEDVNELSIKKDDIVDVAISRSNPTYVRVLWRYSIDDIPESSSPKPSSHYKKKDNKSEEDIQEVFKGKTICVMGYEPGKEGLRTEVEKRGGEFLWLSGRETSATLSSTLGKANAVILMLGHVGHGGTIFAVDYCKRNGIPCGSTHSFGRSNFVVTAEELLNEVE